MVFTEITHLASFQVAGIVFSARFCRALTTLSLVLLGACATPLAPSGAAPGATSQSPETIVRQRATERWDALVRDDIDLAYTYMSPGSRNAVPLDIFKRNVRRGAFREAKIETVSCDDRGCQVRLLVTYDHRLMKGITTPLNEAWVIDNGQAWYVYRE